MEHDKRADGKSIRNSKRQRYEAKQAQRQQEASLQEQRSLWIETNSHCCTRVTLADVRRLKDPTFCTSKQDDAALARLDALLKPYRDLKDGKALGKGRDSQSQERLFIAEGTETVRILIQQSSSSNVSRTSQGPSSQVNLISILVKPASFFDDPVCLRSDVEHACRRESSIAQDSKSIPAFHVLVGDEVAISEIAGFHISRGALACAVAPRDRDEAWLKEFVARRSKSLESNSLRLVALDGVSDSANMGSIIRCCAAFGIDALVLSQDCCDPWYRRSVRVSMGHIVRVPIVRTASLAVALSQLGRMGVVSFAAVIDSDADLVLERIERQSGTVPNTWCCVMGSEANGISTSVKHSSVHRLRIEMVDGVDSLSLPMATGILLHGLKEKETLLQTKVDC